METAEKTKIHHGNNIRRIRSVMGVTQEALAIDLGMSQQAVSKLESKQEVNDETLDKVAEILKVPAKIIKEMSDEDCINVFNNTFNNEPHSACINGNQIFNPTVNNTDQEVLAVLKELVNVLKKK